MALGNLQLEVITLRIEALEKDKILFSLVDKLKACEAKLSAQNEAHKAEVKDLKEKLAEMNENFEVAKAEQEISEMERSRVQKNVEELRDSKKRCYETSLECAKKLKDSFTKVGAYSSEQKFIHGDPKGVIQWIGEEVEDLMKYSVIMGISALSLVHEGSRPFWRKPVVSLLRPQPSQNLFSQLTTPRTPRPKLLCWAGGFTLMFG
jgi:hypothetical protein